MVALVTCPAQRSKVIVSQAEIPPVGWVALVVEVDVLLGLAARAPLLVPRVPDELLSLPIAALNELVVRELSSPIDGEQLLLLLV